LYCAPDGSTCRHCRDAPRMPASSFIFRMIVIGGMGTGKSTFTKALCGNHTAVAGMSEDGSGVTTTITSYPVKDEICKQLGVPQAVILDVPGTGDPDLPPAKLITQLEDALSAVELHAILLMNPAGDSRINIATRIGTVLLDKSFINSADQIIGVLTKADRHRERPREKARKVWGKKLEETFKHKIPITMCSVPVMDDEPYDVIEPDQYEEYGYDPNTAPGMIEVLGTLKKIAANPMVANYQQAGEGIIAEVAEIVGLDIKDMELQIKQLNEEREKSALAQEELKKKLQESEDKAQAQMLALKRETELKDLYEAIRSRCESEEDAIITRAKDESHAVNLFSEECTIAAERFFMEDSKILNSNSNDVKRTIQAFVQTHEEAFKKKYIKHRNETLKELETTVSMEVRENWDNIVNADCCNMCEKMLNDKIDSIISNQFQQNILFQVIMEQHVVVEQLSKLRSELTEKVKKSHKAKIADKQKQQDEIDSARSEAAKKYQKHLQEQKAKMERMKKRMEKIHAAAQYKPNCGDYVKITRSKTTLYDGIKHVWRRDDIYKVVKNEDQESFKVRIVMSADGKVWDPNVQDDLTFPLIQFVNKQMRWDGIFEVYSSETERKRVTKVMDNVMTDQLWRSKEDTVSLVAGRMYRITGYCPSRLCVYLKTVKTNERLTFSVRNNLKEGKEVLEPLEQVTAKEVKGTLGTWVTTVGLGLLGGAVAVSTAPISMGLCTAWALGATTMGGVGYLIGNDIDQDGAETVYE